MNQKNKITIVGGGTAGLVSALMLKSKYSNFDISLIKSSRIGIIGVGEGSTEHWKDFLVQTQIDFKDLIKYADASIKGGVYFTDWTSKPYFHNITKDFEFLVGQKQYNFMNYYKNNLPQLDTTSTWFLKDNITDVNEPSNQFHFNTFKLNDYLQKICLERDIEIIEDEISDVLVGEKGIEKIRGDKGWYESDFYIDSTGFRKILISKLGSKWISYKEYLPLNEAIAFPTKDTETYPAYTLAKAMKYGWMWRIPVYGRWGNGYIFDNNYINADQAKKEVEEYLGYEVKIGKNIKFEAGRIDNSWIKNCLAVGLSSSFLEPLEATSIGYAITQINLFINYYNLNYCENDINIYNSKIKSVMENMRDFVQLHYLVDRNDTDFWKNVKSIKISDTLKSNLKKWEHRFPIREDFTDTSYLMFYENNFASVLYGLELVNKNSVNEEMNTLSKIYADDFEKHNTMWKNTRDNNNYVDHKTYLTNVRSNI